MKAVWAAYTNEEDTRQLRTKISVLICLTRLLSALSYEAETWADTAAMSMKVFTTRRALERCILKFNRRTQHLPGPRSSDLRAMSRLRDPTEHISKAKHK
ncbi:hypothetical protein RB195_001254 [Necator americanus]|uniref:NR LBD domain-containing protein n=1 Tax=Necator americanus TaxID=51031 RepID=A0ABR1DDE7_NECAM